MSKKGDYIVGPHGDGWAATGVGNPRASSVHATQAAAYDAAKGYSAHKGGGDISIQGRNGQIRDKNTIPPATDPRSSKG